MSSGKQSSEKRAKKARVVSPARRVRSLDDVVRLLGGRSRPEISWVSKET
jgi:hypothetical protein